MTQDTSPHFYQIGYCGSGSTRPDCVPLCRPSRRTVEYDCEGLSCEALSGRHLHRLATQTCEKCGLVVRQTRFALPALKTHNRKVFTGVVVFASLARVAGLLFFHLGPQQTEKNTSNRQKQYETQVKEH